MSTLFGVYVYKARGGEGRGGSVRLEQQRPVPLGQLRGGGISCCFGGYWCIIYYSMKERKEIRTRKLLFVGILQLQRVDSRGLLHSRSNPEIQTL